MNSGKPWVLLVASEDRVAQELLGQLRARGVESHVAVAESLARARACLRSENSRGPTAIVLDESAVGRAPLSAAACELARVAPIIVLVGEERSAEIAGLGGLVSAGHADIVPRKGNFIARAVARLERLLEGASSVLKEIPDFESVDLAGAPEDFGEILRHEVNNPLTGILGNAELLLARRESLPAGAVQRLEIIAELAVRLRETIRRLSSAWAARHDQARSA